MKKGYVGLLACASGILIGLGISRLDLTGYLEKTQEQEYHPVERKVPESVESKLKDPKQCWLCGSDERSMMDYFRKFDDLGVICTNHWYVMDMHIRNHDEDGNLTGPQGNGHMGYTGTGQEKAAAFSIRSRCRITGFPKYRWITGKIVSSM